VAPGATAEAGPWTDGCGPWTVPRTRRRSPGRQPGGDRRVPWTCVCEDEVKDEHEDEHGDERRASSALRRIGHPASKIEHPHEWRNRT
jgi:hypothetical protein